tara:strand:+ start:111 stop:263 length:153 start_codon:yes stop_codon:yes gene_type:complete
MEKKETKLQPEIQEQLNRLIRFTQDSNWLKAAYDTTIEDKIEYDTKKFEA